MPPRLVYGYALNPQDLWPLAHTAWYRFTTPDGAGVILSYSCDTRCLCKNELIANEVEFGVLLLLLLFTRKTVLVSLSNTLTSPYRSNT